MKKIYLLPVLAGMVTLASGCATVTRGTTQNVAVDTQPQQAEVTTNSGPSCLSPCALSLKRNMGHTITAKKAGYKAKSAVITNAVAGGGAAGMAGNILVGGIIGMGVDAASGALYDLYPNRLTLVLEEDEDGI